MTVGAFLVARLSSSRLPEKNIRPILNRPMIQHLSERVQRAKCIDKVIITTSDHPTDDALEDLARKIGVDCYRGPLDNVMERIFGAAEKFQCDHIVEVLGDNPLVHSDIIDDVYEIYGSGNFDYCATVTNEYEKVEKKLKKFSIGVRVQIYGTDVAKDHIHYPEYLTNGKHPSAFIFDHPEKYKVGFLEAKGKWEFLNLPEINFSVNYSKNFHFVTKIFENQFPQNSNFGLDHVVQQMQEQKHLVTLLGAE